MDVHTGIIRKSERLLSAVDRNPHYGKWTVSIFATVYYLILSLQGLDFADEGFSLTFYQNIFSHPDDVEYQFLYYLAGLIGGIWEYMFGSIGNYGFRILFAITSGVTVLTAYSIVSRFFKPSTALLACIACILWPGLCLYFFNRDCLTVLLYLLTALFLVKGDEGNNKAWYISGLMIALNCFTRTPNLLLAILVVYPFLAAFYHKVSYRKAITNVIRIAIGTTVGLLLTFTIMDALGHLHPFKHAISLLFVMGSDSSDNHNLMHLIYSYIYTYKGVITSTLYGSLIAASFIIARTAFRNKITHWVATALCLIAFYALLLRNIYALWGLLVAATTLHAIIYRKDFRHLSLSVLAIVMLVVIPLGGDSYYNVCNSCQWLAMPLLVYHLRNQVKWEFTANSHSGEKLFFIENTTSSGRQIALCAGGAFIIYVISHSVCYFDNGSKLHKTHIPDLPLTTTLTSQERATLTETAVNAIVANGNGYDYMMVFDDAPMLHYLTGLRPYSGSSWGTFWGKELFQNQLARAEKSSRQLPLIVIPKFRYKDLSHTDFLDKDKEPKLSDKAEIISAFMQRHNYRNVYDDRYISIYKPGKESPPLM